MGGMGGLVYLIAVMIGCDGLHTQGYHETWNMPGGQHPEACQKKT